EAAVVSRLKLMAKLDIAERRLPQDGRIQLKALGREIDVRVATLPTLYGESLALRLLDPAVADELDLASLGFDGDLLARIERIAALPHGLLLVTGPTGSGKSTTLHAALKRVNSAQRKIITIEDPVEYRLAGVNQIHVAPAIGLTFATGLRHIVRQDPDVIMVGEIRDRETAEIAVRAALTGHCVYSTLHTNDAASAITRLSDMGVERYLLASSVTAVLAQRLVRVLCQQCKRPSAVAESPGGDQVQSWEAVGCEACRGQGYRGRLGIFELLEVNAAVRRAIATNVDMSEASCHGNLRSLQQDAWAKVRQGLTSVAEVVRATQDA
ncbi:MAG: GspE/PulE family protein, partial [Bryobacterales bacterium]|nr:GspE/PulE family protein [Bryobacterales bacterium]